MGYLRRQRNRFGETSSRPRPLFTLLLVFLILFLALSLPRWYLDYLWFKSEDYSSLFLKPLFYKLLLFACFFGISSFSFLAQLFLMFRRDFAGEDVYYPEELFTFRERIRAWGITTLRRFFSIATIVVAFFLALGQSGVWLDYLLAFYGIPFGYRDPVFRKDAKFYVLTVPVFQHLLGFFGAIIFLSILIAVIYYVTVGVVRIFMRGQFEVLHRFARNHLSFLFGTAFFWFGFRYIMFRYALVQHKGPLLTGASRTDIVIREPALLMLAVICFLIGIWFIVFPRRAFHLRSIIVASLSVMSTSLLATLLAAIYQAIWVTPNEVEAEKPYLEYHIEATRFAYGLNALREADFPVETLTESELASIAASALQNMRLWDHRPLLEVYQQVQTFRPYYSFRDVDIDRYRINGELQQLMLAARELDADRLPEGAKNWVNLTFLYTHGYGVVASPVHRSTSEGMPEFYLKDFPVKNTSGEPALEVRSPQIYFGEASYQPVVVKTTYDEVDYPTGDTSKPHRFQADSGIPIGTPARRLLSALYFGNYRFFVSSAIKRDSRLLYRRNIRERLATLLPWVGWSDDPYIVISDGNLYWVVDGFLTASGFPYSQPPVGTASLNYFRSPLKAVISAYSGETRFYIVEDEPLLNTLSRIFPGVFRPSESAPPGIRAHWRYPERLFLVQAHILLRYHIRDPVAFYNQEDLWRIPTELFYREAQPVQPYYILASPDASEPQFILMLPLSPLRKDNLIGWLYAGNDDRDYGELRVYQFPRQTLTYGPMQIEARIDQDPVISKDLTLWSQGGSSVIRGNLLVLPVGRTVLYVEPLFIQAENAKIPQLKRVFLATSRRIVMGETVEDAIRNLTRSDRSVEQAVPPPARTLEADLGRIRSLLQQMDAALKRGDLTEFDRLFRTLKSEVGLR